MPEYTMKSLRDTQRNLFDAGIDAIKVGIEDIASPSRARKVAAIRNFYAGVLLLCKHHLTGHAPPDNPRLLIASEIRFKKSSTGVLRPVPFGTRTISVQKIVQRLNDFDPNLDTNPLKHMQTFRNEIEHYFTTASNEKLQEVFADVQILVHDLLARSNRTNNLGPAWAKLVEESDAYIARKKQCQKDLLQINWRSADVKEAISDLRYAEICDCGSCHIVRTDQSIEIQDNISLTCLTCNSDVSTESFIEALLKWTHGGDDFEAAMAGHPYAVYGCPQCQAEAYLSNKDQCAFCGYVEKDETCEHCGDALGIVHVTNGDSYHDDCAYYANLMAKND